jgi:hypothetical protein
LRAGDRHARPDQARHGRHHGTPYRARDLARGRDPAEGPARLHGLPEPAEEGAHRVDVVDPATSASRTTRAISASPTA